MRLTGLLLVAAAATYLFGWLRHFEGICALGSLAILVVAWWIVRRGRHAAADDDEVFAAESSQVREFVLGVLLGVVWLLAATGVIGALSKTRVHAWFVDEPGLALASELEMLARNGAWSSILAKFERPLPARAGPSVRTRIDRLHYMALTHTAAAIADPLLRCSALREAAAFADSKGIDPLDRSPFTCTVPGSPGQPVGSARIRILKREQDPARRTVLTVAVTDSLGAPLSRLDKSSFLAVAQGQEVPVADVVYAPTVSPPRRFAIVVGPLRSRVHAATARVTSGVLSGLIRSVDRVETVTCCSSDADLPVVLGRALASIRSQPGGLILLTDATVQLPPLSADTLRRDLRAAQVPLHLLVFGNGGDALRELETIAHDSGGRRLILATADVPAIRNALAEPLIGEGVYFVALDGSFRHATVALATPRRGGP
jgi:hypothetical protein